MTPASAGTTAVEVGVAVDAVDDPRERGDDVGADPMSHADAG